MNILLRDFNAKFGKEDTFKPAIKNWNLHKISNDNDVRIVTFCLVQKSDCQKYVVSTL
jgi:hypothetical protein